MSLYLEIPKDGYHIDRKGIKAVEKAYGAKYMGFWCTKRNNGAWNETPVDVFYQPHADTEKGHSNYFGIYVQQGKPWITNAESAFSEPITGAICDDGEVIVSRYRHDYVEKKGAMIDGGRDYIRSNMCRLASVSVENNNFIIKQHEEFANDEQR